jgi:hypothetical protein
VVGVLLGWPCGVGCVVGFPPGLFMSPEDVGLLLSPEDVVGVPPVATYPLRSDRPEPGIPLPPSLTVDLRSWIAAAHPGAGGSSVAAGHDDGGADE